MISSDSGQHSMMSLLFRLGGTLDPQTDDALLGVKGQEGSFASLLQGLQNQTDQLAPQDLAGGQLPPLATPIAANTAEGEGQPLPLLDLPEQSHAAASVAIDQSGALINDDNPVVPDRSLVKQGLAQASLQASSQFTQGVPDPKPVAGDQPVTTPTMAPPSIENTGTKVDHLPNMPKALAPLITPTVSQNDTRPQALPSASVNTGLSPLDPAKILGSATTTDMVQPPKLNTGVDLNSPVIDPTLAMTKEGSQAIFGDTRLTKDMVASRTTDTVITPHLEQAQDKPVLGNNGQAEVSRVGPLRLDTDRARQSETQIQQSVDINTKPDVSSQTPRNSTLVQPFNGNNSLNNTVTTALTNQPEAGNPSVWQNPNGTLTEEPLASDEMALRSAALIRSNLQSINANSNDMSNMSDSSGSTLAASGSTFTSALTATTAQGSERAVNNLVNEGFEISEAIEQAQLEQDDMAAETMKFGQDRREWSGALGQRIMTMVAQDIQQARIQLDPPELGALEIKLQVQQDQASVQVHAQHGQVREVLEQNIFRLKEALQQQGIELTDSEFTDGEFNQAEQNLANQESEQQDLSGRSSSLANNASDNNDNSALELDADDNSTLSQAKNQQGIMNQQGRLDTFV